MAYFPMFLDLTGKDCLVVGGGEVALRKVKMLLDFDATVTVIAPRIAEELYSLSEVTFLQRKYEMSDLAGRTLVVAATDEKEQNREICKECKERGIPVNAVTEPENGTFYFPAYLKKKQVVAAFSSGGQGPVVSQYLKAQTEKVMTDLLGEMAEYMGAIRLRVIQEVPEKERRREVFRQLFSLGMESGQIPDEAQYKQILDNHRL